MHRCVMYMTNDTWNIYACNYIFGSPDPIKISGLSVHKDKKVILPSYLVFWYLLEMCSKQS